MAVPFNIYTFSVWKFQFPPALVMINLFSFNHSKRYKTISHCGLLCISQITNIIMQFWMYLLATLISSLVKFLFKLFSYHLKCLESTPTFANLLELTGLSNRFYTWLTSVTERVYRLWATGTRLTTGWSREWLGTDFLSSFPSGVPWDILFLWLWTTGSSVKTLCAGKPIKDSKLKAFIESWACGHILLCNQLWQPELRTPIMKSHVDDQLDVSAKQSGQDSITWSIVPGIHNKIFNL